jgi:hypothetical protein
MNNKGQSIFSEYVMIFFVVIAAAVAMTTFVQRGFEARIHDARNYLITTVNSACDANCMNATGANSIPFEYEPYYEQFLSTVQNYERDASGATLGTPVKGPYSSSPLIEGVGAIYLKAVNGEANSNSTSNQLPPECAGANPPPYCGNGQLPPGG